jgi:predicted AlkP superfamily phosphohydrolase/phosphomutase
LSDHGSAPASAALFVNEYLAENGMLKTNDHVKQRGEVLTKFRSWLLRNLSPETIARVYKISPSFISKRLTLSGSIDRVLQNLVDNVNWDETACFSTGGHQAHFYITNQDEDSARSALRDKLISIMSQLTDPASGQKIRPVFHLREDTFKGPFQDEAPDLCVELYSGNEKVQISPRLGTGKLWSMSPHFSSIHTREGFWALTGPNVRQALRLDAGLLDLAPTLLHLLGIDTSTDFDGKILDSAISVDKPNQASRSNFET